MTPLGALMRGLIAGAIGTLAKDAFDYLRTGGREANGDFVAWEFGAPSGWDEAPAPALVGKRLYEGFTQRALGEEWVGPTNNVVHWGYGIAWAGLYGLVAGSRPRPRARQGLLFGTTVWLSGYVTLPIAGLYEPIWTYDTKTLAKDLGGHVVYGLITSTIFKLLSGGRGAG